jgi:hypothetical protein
MAAPAVTAARLMEQGGKVTAFVLSFNRPMSPAAVDNVHHYLVNRPGKFIQGNWFDTLASVSVIPIQLKSAQYDSATNTVTLTPHRPLKIFMSYTIGSPLASSTKNDLTDSQGNVIQEPGRPPGFFLIEI